MEIKKQWFTVLLATVFVGASAHASIIYSNINDVTTAVGSTQDISFSLTGEPGDDFDIAIGISGPYPMWSAGVSIITYSAVAVANNQMANLSAGTDIKSQSWSPSMWADYPVFTLDDDLNGWKDSTGYVGLRVQQGDFSSDYIYGWAEIVVVENADPEERSITLTRYAYEDQVNTTITAGAVPEPATAGLLAGAGLVIALYRRFFSRV